MYLRILVVFSVLLVLSGCSDVESREVMIDTKISNLSEEALTNLSQRTFFFGHQSVGRNMMAGLEEIIAANDKLTLNILESESQTDIKPGAFLHANVGKNRAPDTKISHFESAISGGLGNNVDAAFLKFCYVDLLKEEDAVTLFEDYKKSVESLKAKYPETIFVHFTLPVKTVKTGWKAYIKNLIGKEDSGHTNNIWRGTYNQLLRDTYTGKDPIFDIAHLESIDPETGVVTEFMQDGKMWQAMSPDSTYDSGHLNEKGRSFVAEQLIVFLSDLNYKK